MGEDDAGPGVEMTTALIVVRRVDAEPTAALGLVEAGLGDDVRLWRAMEFLAVLRGRKREVHAREFDLNGGGGEGAHEGHVLLAAGVDGGCAHFLGLTLLFGGLLLGERSAPIAT